MAKKLGASEATPSRFREFTFATLTILLSLLGCGIVAEIVLRFLPVADVMPTLPVTHANPILHFRPESRFTYSHGWNFDIVNRGLINSAGWVNDQPYAESDTRPLLAIVGDSFVEAAMVPYAQTLQGRLAAALKDKFRVYSFGVSGAPLSQYVALARYAAERFHPQAIVINVVGNDFDESHVKYSNSLGMWLYVPQADGALHLKLFEYHRGLVRPIVERSALLRYLLINLDLVRAWRTWRLSIFGAPASAAEPYAGQTASTFDKSRIDASLEAVEAALRDLPQMTGMPPHRTLFTLDGFRYAAVAQSGAGTYFDAMRRAFLQKATAAGFEVVDLDPLFFKQAPQRFEFPTDGHWNSNGHRVAAEGVLGSRLLSRLTQP